MEEAYKYQSNTKKPTSVISLEKGKLPPQDVKLEEVVLGAMLIDDRGVTDAIEVLGKSKKVFYKDNNQIIYNAIVEMFEDRNEIDLLTVSSKLKSINKLDEIGGEVYLVNLTQKVSSAAHIEFHCRILLQFFVKRESIKMASKIIEQAYSEETDIFDLLADSHKSIDDVSQSLIKKIASDFKTIVSKLFDDSEKNTPGIPSKLRKLNNKFNGYHPTDLTIVAARPGMGKTALILNEAKHQAIQEIPVGIFSLEMGAIQLAGRMLSEFCEINSSNIKKNTLNDFEKRRMRDMRADFEKLPIYINDTAAITPLEMRLQIGKWVRDFGVKIIYVDYLQLMSASGVNKSGNREQEISYISRSLKAIAKEFNIPVIALSQLSRAVETRGGMKRPILSDLRESGAIEQDADNVMFLLRPEYYKIDEWDDDERTPTKGQCEINIAKSRGDELGQTVVAVDLQYMRFKDLEEPFEKDLPPPPNHNPTNDDWDDLPDAEPEDDTPF